MGTRPVPQQDWSAPTVIVAGHITVEPQQCESYLAGCARIVEQARRAVGCLDVAICADLVDPGRVNIFERWESQAALETFRSSGPDTETAPGDAHGVRSGVRHRRRTGRVRGGCGMNRPDGLCCDRCDRRRGPVESNDDKLQPGRTLGTRFTRKWAASSSGVKLPANLLSASGHLWRHVGQRVAWEVAPTGGRVVARAKEGFKR
jgi:quinol monooxygenase YgiN